MLRKKVVIVGGGFGGLNTAMKLRHSKGVEVTLIDKTNHHVFQPLLYQTVGALLSVRDIATNLRQVFAKYPHINVIMGEVIRIEQKHVMLGNGELLPFDYLVIATGARHSYFGQNHWEQFAPGLKTVADAVEMRERILTAFERAERIDSHIEMSKYLTFAVIGGGPTGVELAGNIAEMIHRTLKQNFRRIRMEKAQVILIEGLERILPSFDPKLSERAKEDLEKLGVEVQTKRKVTEITAEGIFVDDEFIPCGTVLWAAGNAASPLLQTLDVPLDRQGRAQVERDLSIPGRSNVFVIGDAASYIDKGRDTPLPGVASVAIQQGRFLGRILRDEIRYTKQVSTKRPTFHYFDKGSLATIGEFKAVAEIKKFKCAGIFAWIIWAFVHLVYLITFRNRLSVMFEWFFHHLTKKRPARIIYHSIEDKLPRIKKSKTQIPRP